MATGLQNAKRVALFGYIIVIHLALFYFVGERLLSRFTAIRPIDDSTVSGPNLPAEIPTPIPVPEAFVDPTPSNANTTGSLQPDSLPPLLVPVAGVRPEQLIDTFSDSREEGRFHDAIDIPAPAGTPVVAAADGEIVKFWDSERGGITIYQLTSDRRYLLYYAHLQRRADEIRVGMKVTRGATIGFVGDTGNAGSGNYHLHFSISAVADPKRFADGIPLNPYPWLRSGQYPK